MLVRNLLTSAIKTCLVQNVRHRVRAELGFSWHGSAVGAAMLPIPQTKSSSGLVGTTHMPLGLFYPNSAYCQQVRCFHAKGSKVRYLDFRYKFNTCHLRSHLLIIRRQKMKKHRRKKWRKKFKTVLAKMRLKREIAKEKTFRVELLTMIKRAEQFDPREYALEKINEINNKPKEPTREERLEELKELIRKNRYQVDYIKPKHRRFGV